MLRTNLTIYTITIYIGFSIKVSNYNKENEINIAEDMKLRAIGKICHKLLERIVSF